ncbi:RNA-binding component of cleavage and polyadenylation factor [Entomophthora muscae]|uniref:RNA-binding component of cleavage and polyadenylation factor n=1 Tax=Entomophthora muscae TaxID=34485 RepID=A0ACC2UPP5_9FUNG|nr:RNA-binding component of cleavage and polyadenylation factor [Entomophthora muscae]
MSHQFFPDPQADLVKYKFGFEDYVITKLGLDVYGENKKNTQGGVCIMFLKGGCPRGLQCPYKHIKSEKSVVCKHWLRGLCKKEDQCEFLHEYNLKKNARMLVLFQIWGMR